MGFDFSPSLILLVLSYSDSLAPIVVQSPLSEATLTAVREMGQ